MGDKLKTGRGRPSGEQGHGLTSCRRSPEWGGSGLNLADMSRTGSLAVLVDFNYLLRMDKAWGLNAVVIFRGYSV